MGTMPFAQLASFSLFNTNKYSGNLPSASATGLAAPDSECATCDEIGTQDSLGTDREQQIANQFEATVYRSKTQQISLSARLQEVAASFNQESDGETAAVGFQTQQLAFDFFAESKQETLVQFGRRSQQTADKLQGAQQESFIQASQRVAARFEFSATMSGESLTGFSTATDGAATDEDVFRQLLDWANQLLSAADDAFNEFFSLFSGTGNAASKEGKTDFIQQMMDQFMSALGDFFSKSSAGAANGAQSSAVSVQVQMEFEFSIEMSAQTGVQQSDPVMLDLDNDGFELSNYQSGAQFDILGNGKKVTTAFVNGGDAFLAMDRDGDGKITSGKELFGDQNGAANGFEELRKLDSNSDGLINRLDKDFSKLTVWRDNGNGVNDDGELQSLTDAGISEISVGYRNVDWQAAGGNRIAQAAYFRRTDGQYGAAADAILNYKG